MIASPHAAGQAPHAAALLSFISRRECQPWCLSGDERLWIDLGGWRRDDKRAALQIRRANDDVTNRTAAAAAAVLLQVVGISAVKARACSAIATIACLALAGTAWRRAACCASIGAVIGLYIDDPAFAAAATICRHHGELHVHFRRVQTNVAA